LEDRFAGETACATMKDQQLRMMVGQAFSLPARFSAAC
jgi:hypothetical protein